MSMTREEAIERYEGIRYTVACFTGSKKDCDAVDMAFSALRPVSWEKVEKVWRGHWVKCKHADYYVCNKCSTVSKAGEDEFCKSCGTPMTDEAVQMVLERLEALHGETD